MNGLSYVIPSYERKKEKTFSGIPCHYSSYLRIPRSYTRLPSISTLRFHATLIEPHSGHPNTMGLNLRKCLYGHTTTVVQFSIFFITQEFGNLSVQDKWQLPMMTDARVTGFKRVIKVKIVLTPDNIWNLYSDIFTFVLDHRYILPISYIFMNEIIDLRVSYGSEESSGLPFISS